MPKCKKCGSIYGIKTKEQKKTEYEIIMAKFNKRKAIKGVMTEQKKVKLEGRF